MSERYGAAGGGRGTWVTLQSTEHVGGTKERNETHLPLTLRALGVGVVGGGLNPF